MQQQPNKLSQFWQELKRRRVVRVIIVYAAASFVILELTSIIAEPFGLPDWTLKLVFVILCIGMIISIILSWVYDITPEGVEKTRPVAEIKEEISEKPSDFNAWKIATIISVVIIVGLVIFHAVDERKQAEDHTQLDKSIAILPFINDSPDEENEYFINGIMEAILDNLCKIEDLRVVGRTSVEQYRDAPKPIPVIAKEMNVSYILEGSGQKYGDNIRLTIQLLDAINDKHLWSSPYSREIEIEEIFAMQSEIAQLVAAELEAIITPEEKQLIERKPTTSLTAYDFYQRGDEVLWNYSATGDSVDLERAEDFFQKALEYDSTFSQAYAGMGWIYWFKHDSWDAYFSEDYLDSVLIIADIALSYDGHLAEAYDLKGNYFNTIGKTEQAIEEFEKAVQFNPNNWQVYMSLGLLYSGTEECDLALHNLYQASILHRGESLRWILYGIVWTYLDCGFDEQAKTFLLDAFMLDSDTASYFRLLSFIEQGNENYSKSAKYLEDAYVIDSSNINILRDLGWNYMFLGQFEKSLKYYEKYFERLKAVEGRELNNLHRIGYVYWQNGYEKEAEYYFNKQLNVCNELIELKRPLSNRFYTYYDLAGIYAFRGEKDKAFENLRIFNQKQKMPKWMVTLINDDPLFDSIRDEPEFQQIVRDVEAKYQAEHERVRKWLEEQGML